MASVLRGMVSKKKRRFQENGFDLDLTYITDRIIAMGFPSEKLEGIYRNPMSEVQKFLDTSHEAHYRVYNLCSERRYDHKKFHNRVLDFPFDDHNCPELERITTFCEDVQSWLDADPANVVVIHCKAGKGRTGLMICCYLQYCRKCATASEALQLFAQRRTLNQKGVTLHSQRRYVQYFEKVLLEGPRDPVVLQLERIRMHTIPKFQMGGGSEPWFSISRGNRTIYYSDPVKGKKGAQVVDFECSNLLLSRDIKIEFFNKTLKGKMFYFWFHTSYIKNNYLCLRKRDLEKACKDKACKHYQAGFKIEVFFKTIEKTDRDRSVTTCQISTDMGVCGACNSVVRAEDQSMTLNNLVFHWDCLRCYKCGRSFGGNRNCIVQDGQVTCERCDIAEFFTRCAACNRVLTEYTVVEADNLAWHSDCFRCTYCKELLDHKDESKHVVVDGLPYCVDHEGMTPGMKVCASASCTKRGVPAEISALGKDWHIDCFVCVDCGDVLDSSGNKYIMKGGMPACDPAIGCGVAVTCRACKQPVARGDMVMALGEAYHRSTCFSCGLCNATLDVNNVQMRGEKLYCATHEMHTCQECSDLIPEGELVTAGDMSGKWHERCFKCAICSTVLDTRKAASFVVSEGTATCMSHHLQCTLCGSTINDDSELVRIGGRDWHSSCCVCMLEGCNAELASVVHVELDGKFYCSTHPHCDKCHDVIASHELVEDEQGNFHQRCFTCGMCGQGLTPGQFAFDDEMNVLCFSCHPGPFCCVCSGILPDQHLIILESRYHYECFCCVACEQVFESVDDPVAVTEDGKPICLKCSSISCHKCGESISGEVIEALDNSYHLTCFVCTQCNNPLMDQFGLKDDEFYCASCLMLANLPKCTGCEKAIEGRHTVAGGKPFHFECFNCANCGSPFPTGGGAQFLVSEVGFFCLACESAYTSAAAGGQAVPHTPPSASAVEVGDGDAAARRGSASFRKSMRFSSPTAALEARKGSLAGGSLLSGSGGVGVGVGGGGGGLGDAESNRRPSGAFQSNLRASSGVPTGGSGGGESAGGAVPSGDRSSNGVVGESATKSSGGADDGGSGGASTVPASDELANDTARSAKVRQGREGYLKKKGAKRRNWKKRYFKLHGKVLSYYKSPKDSASIGDITLTSVCQVMVSNDRAHSFDLVTPDRTYYLVADDDADQHGWMDAIREALTL